MVVLFNMNKVGTEGNGEARQVFSERSIFPVVTADKLLSPARCEKVLNDIQTIVGAPERQYNVLYADLINSFSEFVQILPVTNQSRLGGLLAEGLQRAYFALEVFKEGKERPHPLWNYVLFSAGLMFDIGKVIEDRNVIISDKRGAYLRKWLPYNGGLLGQADYYRIRRGGGMPPWLCRRMAPLFAQKIMPKAGFNWIASKPKALTIWFALLSDEAGSTGGYGIIFNKALELLENFRASTEFFNLPVSPVEPEQTALGEDFLEWLRDGLADGSIELNALDGHVHLVEEGLFLQAPEIFQQFVNERQLSVNRDAVMQQFNLISGQDGTLQQYDIKNPKVQAKGSLRDYLKVSMLKANGQQAAAAAAKADATSTRFAEGITARKAAVSGGVFPGSTLAKMGVVSSPLTEWVSRQQNLAVDQNAAPKESKASENADYPTVTATIETRSEARPDAVS